MQAKTVVRSEYEMPVLLGMAGARPRGNRFDCPKCGGFRTITHTAECFICHKCGWKGNLVTLRNELGLKRRLPRAEYRRLRRQHERADRAARALYELIRARRFELYASHQTLLDILYGSHARLQIRAEDKDAWSALAFAYREINKAQAELLLLEDGQIEAQLVWLQANARQRERMLTSIIAASGLIGSSCKFLGLDDPAPVCVGLNPEFHKEEKY